MNRLRELRQLTGKTLAEVAEDLSLTSQALSRYERGEREPDTQQLVIFANYYKASVDYILCRSDSAFAFDLTQYADIEPLPLEYDLTPLVGTIACGTPALAEENIEEYIRKDKRIKADFALRCKGDSMINARIFDGDIVYIKQQEDVENGEIAAVLLGNEATLKRVYKYPNRIELRPENPTFAPLNYEGEELAQIKILGKAVAFLSTVR